MSFGIVTLSRKIDAIKRWAQRAYESNREISTERRLAQEPVGGGSSVSAKSWYWPMATVVMPDDAIDNF